MSALPKGLSMRAYSLMEIRRDPQTLKAAKQYVYDHLADGRFPISGSAKWSSRYNARVVIANPGFRCRITFCGPQCWCWRVWAPSSR